MGVTRWLTIVLSVAGAAVATWAVATHEQSPPPVPPSRPPSVNPFGRGVSALGIVEPRGRVVAISAPESGLITHVAVDVGDVVTPGTVLFTLDSRSLESQLVRAEAAVAVGEGEVARLRAQPRSEDVAPLEAALARAMATLADREEDLQRVTDASGAGAATDRDESRRRFAVDEARAGAAQAKAELDRVRAGAWSQDITVAELNLSRLQAEAQSVRILIDRMTVRAPANGTVIRRSIEPGEMAMIDASRPSLLVADLGQLFVRAQVDEEDIPLIRTGQRAQGRARGGAVDAFALTFVRVEPYASAKSQIANTNAERVDTRVVDVLFSVDGPSDTPLYPGQAIDVFIDAGAFTAPGSP